jgi:ribosomal protein S18 acetylase RimI-like enzyme
MYTVLPAVSADGSEIHRIAREISQFSTEERDCVRELWKIYLENGKESPYCFCVCKDQETGKIAGFACYGKHALTKSTYDLYWIAVDPLIQRTGAGSTLLNYIEEQVSKIHDSRLMIETSSTPPYLSARKFYKRHHYIRVALLRDFYAPGDHLVIFSKHFKCPRESVKADNTAAEFSNLSDLLIRWDQNRYN